MPEQGPEIITRSLVSVIVSAHVSNNSVASSELPRLISSVHEALSSLASLREPEAPAVPIGKSVLPDEIVCLECGRTAKMLKRHLNNAHGLTPAAYREKWRLSSDYPMTAPNYAAWRSKIAKEIGLGRSGKKAKSVV